VAEDQNQNPVGLQFTLFRFVVSESDASHWSNGQMWMGHVSVHTDQTHLFEQKFALGGVGNAGVATEPFAAYIDQWSWKAASDSENALFPSYLDLPVSDSDHITLNLNATGPSVKHGDKGISVKSADGRFWSYYYSQPFIEVEGNFVHDGHTLSLKGLGWFDHEWTNQLARSSALGWDWLSLHLDDGRKLMVFRMHVDEQPPYLTGSLISPSGQRRTLDESSFTFAPSGTEHHNGRTLPVKWQLHIPDETIKLDIRPFKSGQFNEGLFPYYEGRVSATGSHKAKGFLELTGYE
jgi:predicted secreted hydrolase